MPTILVVDDEGSIRRTLREILEYEDYAVDVATEGSEALTMLRETTYDAVLLDIKMPAPDGMEVLRTLADEQPTLPVIMISGHATIETAVEATKLGAYDFIEKPPDLNRLLVTVRNALDRNTLEVENQRMRQMITEQAGDLSPIIGESDAIADIKATIDRVAATEARVLITGENGTGKELVARWIHQKSGRADAPLVEVNCAAIPSELIESELFGHEKGSFTGATQQRIGKFEQADGGTLFLDEIGDMSASAQAKVLRALQESTIQRVGGGQPIEVDVRVVAATNKDLMAEMEEGRFREDLYHRIGVILIDVPPLRHRRDDIPPLARHFAQHLARRHGMQPRTFTDAAIQHLRQAPWRGNVRELQNVVERLLILADGDTITAEAVERHIGPSAPGDSLATDLIHSHEDFTEARDAFERAFIQHKLNAHDWNVSQTAETIGIQRSHLYNKLNKYGIERGD
ncbi:sigma-54-dependent transcriptional regulator [Salisaeta longa]|uniref:sigma-54-dependent transcriptional regulator n=1 Tax=Salisaeta longa TaxID=503170 RepID=UPI0003B3AD42|nr:sigma-54 dependent transcriptional regulator [Salisaeta longa]